MGKGRRGQKRGRTQRKHFKENRENVWKKTRPDPSSNAPPWEPFATQNPAFDEYYKEQGIVPEDEWEVFLSTLQKALPAAFRINSSGQFFQDIRSQLENDFMKSLEAEGTDESEMVAIRPLPWYPENLAWHLNFSRMQLRKNQTLERFHEFLKLENEIGNITRQEAVSMVPPLFLDVRSDHYVLDMCAAPGSKTFQLLEIIHQSSQPGSLPDGMIIANDVDVQRCNLLIHQTKRMCSANLIVTNHEAQHFPSCHLNMSNIRSVSAGSMASSQAYEGPKEAGKSPLLFDRVLCDVPCSGDGTLRKAPDIWRKWSAGMGNGIHCLQVQVAMRGIALLKVGGRMVYSTCSMNPVENEAVVAEILRRCGGSVELLDVSAELPQLVRRPGLKKWKVRGRSLWLTSYKDLPEYRKFGILPSMFPSGQSCELEKSVSVGVQDDITKADNDNGIGSLSSLEKGHHNGGDVDLEHGLVQLENIEPLTDIAEPVTEMEEPPNQCSSPKDCDVDCEAEVSDLPLERCMRIIPHDQNTGAFFIAVLHKISPLNAVSENRRSLHKNSTQTRQDLPEKLSNSMIEDKCRSETTPSDDAPDYNHCLSSEAALDTDLLDEQSADVPMEVALQVSSHETCAKDNGLKESNSCDGGESGRKRVEGDKGRLQSQGRWRGVDPVVFFRDEATINSIRTFYGISELFPFDGHLVTRNSDAHHVKRIYYISRSVCGILERNLQSGQQLKITSLGLKIFERQTSKEGSSPCAFRISSEGLPLLLPYISKQILCASITDFEHLLRYRSIKFADFVDPGFGEKASNLLVGCCIVVLNKGDGPLTSDAILVDTSTIAIGCWKGRTNLALMVSQVDSQQLLERLCVRLGREKGVPVPENELIIEPDAKEEKGKDAKSNENCEAAMQSTLG